jgi:hypothetical protein
VGNSHDHADAHSDQQNVPQARHCRNQQATAAAAAAANNLVTVWLMKIMIQSSGGASAFINTCRVM